MLMESYSALKGDESMEQAGLPVKRTDAIANRTRILEAALAVFAEQGLNLEIGEVATRANLAVGTLYRHFANREDLLRAILTYTLDDTLAKFQVAVSGAPDDPCEALLALIVAGLRSQQQYGSIFAIIRDSRLRTMFDPAQAQTIRGHFLAVVLSVLEEGVKANLFRNDLDLRLVAATILGSIMGVSDLFHVCCPLEELAQKLHQLHLAMLTGH
jgi:AcrR family transcriptional regulator